MTYNILLISKNWTEVNFVIVYVINSNSEPESRGALIFLATITLSIG